MTSGRRFVATTLVPAARAQAHAAAALYFLRPNGELRLDAWLPREAPVDLLRVVTGALGATFARGTRRTLVRQPFEGLVGKTTTYTKPGSR